MMLALFQNATEGIIVTDGFGKIVLINPRIERMFGYTQEELIGLTVDIFIPSAKRTHHQKLREEYHSHPQARSMGTGMNLEGVRKDGSNFSVEVSLSPFKTKRGTYVLCFVVDVTNRKIIDDELKHAHIQLKDSNNEILMLNQHLENKVKERTVEMARLINELAKSKNEAIKALEKEKKLNELKSRFVSTASHEFRTPLGTILSSASLIARYVGEGENDKRLKHIERIKSAVNTLTDILNDFLSLDKLEQGFIKHDPESIILSDVLTSIFDDMKPLLKEGQNIVLINEITEKRVVLDVKLFKNVMFNLISNAIKYSEPDQHIEVISKLCNSCLQVAVKDYGMGIAKEEHKHLFERFFRANNVTNIQGTGLGLNIVKKYLDIMSGEIEFESELNKGSTFTITIPQ